MSALLWKNIVIKTWGNLDEEDKQANEDALGYSDDIYILGAYNTCICFPDER